MSETTKPTTACPSELDTARRLAERLKAERIQGLLARVAGLAGGG